ncbi:MAG: PspC domain-containing protein [Steroidobacteraceae bacterium]|jgi:phage shock protein PspC (stress-responsive transcriptional regulator)
MQRVITVSLNHNSYVLEEDAHARLEHYLAESAATLSSNPDRAEILADLEQAIADQCNRRLQPGHTVITLAELQPALEEIGRVADPAASESVNHGAAAETVTRPGLEQVSEGAWISGVCNGLARSASIDVTLTRVIALLLLFVTGGTMVLLYVVLMLLIPYAPLQLNAPPLRKIPAKCREIVTSLRAKIAAMV